MKKILVLAIISLLFSGLSLNATPVPRERALEIGKKILAAQPATKAGSGQISIVWDGEEVATKSALPPAFYVVARDGGGFVIIAGDDNATPVLAISDRNEFKVEGMPDNVKWWMDRMKDYIRGSKTQAPEVETQWASLIGTKAALPEQYITNEYLGSRTCEWNQSAPGNALAPTVTGQEQSVAGCLPLAMAEILTWHGWPNQAVGSSSAYTYESGNHVSVTIPSYNLASNIVIDQAGWEALQALKTNALYTSCSGDTRANLEKLIYACGVILGAHFNNGSYGGTSSSSAYVASAFGEHMGYNKAAYRDFLSYQSSLDQWNLKLKSEISRHPVLYCGQSSSGSGNDSGHAYVFDGFAMMNYEENEYDVFHVNFGWGGNCNGYYFSYYQDPAIPQGYIYKNDLEALFDFYPDRTGESFPVNFVDYADVPGLAFVDPFIVNAWFRVSFALINTGSVYNGKLIAKLIDRFGNKKTDIEIYTGGGGWTDLISDLSYKKMSQLYLLVPGGTSIDFGDRIVLYCSTNPEMTIFRPLTGPNDGTIVCELPVMPVPFIKTDASYSVGDYFHFQLMNLDTQYMGTEWTITDPDKNKTSNIPQSQREFRLTKSGTYKIEAAVAPKVGAAVVETVVTYILVN